jgi:hypothetical protein
VVCNRAFTSAGARGSDAHSYSVFHQAAHVRAALLGVDVHAEVGDGDYLLCGLGGRAQQHGQAQTTNADRMQRDPALIGLRRDIG